MRHDLLGRLSEMKDATHAVVLTHNIDFVFIETIVLSALRRCGHPPLTVFADATRAAESFARQAPLLHRLGVRYRVIGVEMEPGFRFHPKALLLSGPSTAMLFVGSGNLTFGGWRENGEVWVEMETGADGTAPFASFQRYLRGLVGQVALPEVVRPEIEEAFDPKSHAWAADMGEPDGLLAKSPDGPALLDAMLARLGGAVPEKVTVCAPYFDEEAEALAAIAARSGAPSVEVLVQPGRTGLTERAWTNVAASVRLAPTTFQHFNEVGEPREAFLHAKFYGFERAGRVTLFAGSANCSRAALTIPGRAGNAELMAVREMASDEFRAAFLDELVAKEGGPGLATDVAKPTPPAPTTLRILGASYDHGRVQVAYAPRGCRIMTCLLDGAEAPFERTDDGFIRARAKDAPTRVVLHGIDGATAMRSAAAWVDHEVALRATARGRSLEDAVRRRVRTEEWGVGAWQEVLEAFCSYLRYVAPERPTARPARRDSEDPRPIEFSRQDVFTSGYGLPPLTTDVRALDGASDRIRSLQQLLLRWFGSPVVPDETEPAGKTRPATGGDGNEVVDEPETLPAPAEEEDAKADIRNRKRTARLVAQMQAAMTSREFLEERPPELLGNDLRLASALLRVALRAPTAATQTSWLDTEDFFRATHEIWIPMFLDAEGRGDGWLQRRYEAAPDRSAFAAALASPEMLAALVAWVAAVPDQVHTPAHARFALAAALAVARLPWLWDGIDDALVHRELAELLACTSPSVAVGELETVGQTWLRLIRRGHAIRRLELALVGMTPAQLAPRVRTERIARGDLLWQGTAGFGVAVEDACRGHGGSVGVLPLRGDAHAVKRGGRRRSAAASAVKRFSVRVTVPLLALLDDSVLPPTREFGDEPRDALRVFLAGLADGLASVESRDE